jgi:hypothetical protein
MMARNTPHGYGPANISLDISITYTANLLQPARLAALLEPTSTPRIISNDNLTHNERLTVSASHRKVAPVSNFGAVPCQSKIAPNGFSSC